MRKYRKTLSLVLLAITLLTSLLIPVTNSPQITLASTTVAFGASQSGTVNTSDGQVSYVRRQLGPQGSSSYLVWTERNESQSPDVSGLFDSFDVVGLDLSNNTVLDIASGSGNQWEPAISGDWVVWADTSHSCETCEMNILAKNLATGAKVTIASGAADQSSPDISGSSVVWIESSGQNEKIMVGSLSGTGTPYSIAVVTPTVGTTLANPLISDQYVVWTELVDVVSSGKTVSIAATFKAYNRSNSAIYSVAQTNGLYLDYALDGSKLVWSDDKLYLTDLSSSQTSTLFALAGGTPSINGNIVLWSATSGNETNGLEIWGKNLLSSNTSANPILLVSETGDQKSPVAAGDKLTWQTEGPTTGSSTHGRLSTTSLSSAFASPPSQPQLPIPAPTISNELDNVTVPAPAPMPTREEILPTPGVVTNSENLQVTNPTVKGIHAPNADIGWNVGPTQIPKAVNALVNTSQNYPYFGTVVEQLNDLTLPSRSASPWGPTVAWVMRRIREYNKEVIIRTQPAKSSECTAGESNPPQIYQPTTNGSRTPQKDADVIIQCLAGRTWVSRVQMENEPDLEWNMSCIEGCWWIPDPPPLQWVYIWTSRFDPRFYMTINNWYKDARQYIWNYTSTCNDNPSSPTFNYNCYNLKRRISIWTPPMNAGVYSRLTGNIDRWDLLAGLIGKFGCTPSQVTTKCFSYHAYPAPSIPDQYGSGLRNNSWDYFNADMKARINDGRTRSQITEFGWDPGILHRPDGNHPAGCTKTQQDSWAPPTLPATPTRCEARDGYPHTFYGDTIAFETLTQFRHHAEVIAVWITSGYRDDLNDERADGLDPSSGDLRNWFYVYQQSNP